MAVQIGELSLGNSLKYCNQEIIVLGLSRTEIECGYFTDSIGFSRRPEEVDVMPITKEWLVKLKFEKVPHFTVNNAYTLNVGRKRIISVGNVGTPNEMIWLCQINSTDEKKIDDLICLRNYDYDGYTHVHTLQNIISDFSVEEK